MLLAASLGGLQRVASCRETFNAAGWRPRKARVGSDRWDVFLQKYENMRESYIPHLLHQPICYICHTQPIPPKMGLASPSPFIYQQMET